MADFADSIMRKCRHNKMSALQYLEHCIRVCYHRGDYTNEQRFVDVRDFIEREY